MASSISRSRRRAPPVLVIAVLRSAPRRGPPPPGDVPRSLPRSAPLRARRPAELGRGARGRAMASLPPTRAILVEQLGDGRLHPKREGLVGFALARPERPTVTDADRRAAGLWPEPALRHRCISADDGD